MVNCNIFLRQNRIEIYTKTHQNALKFLGGAILRTSLAKCMAYNYYHDTLISRSEKKTVIVKSWVRPSYNTITYTCIYTSKRCNYLLFYIIMLTLKKNTKLIT